MKQRNFIGRLVGRRRNQLDWTQDVFADKLQLAGWHNATRSTVSKIEDGSLRIDLTQLFYLAVALGVHPIHFLPEIDWRKQVEKLNLFPMKHPQTSEDVWKPFQKTKNQPATPPIERLAYSMQEAADMLGVHYFSIYRLIQRSKLKICRALRGKLLVPRTELLKLLGTDLR